MSNLRTQRPAISTAAPSQPQRPCITGEGYSSSTTLAAPSQRQRSGSDDKMMVLSAPTIQPRTATWQPAPSDPGIVPGGIRDRAARSVTPPRQPRVNAPALPGNIVPFRPLAAKSTEPPTKPTHWHSGEPMGIHRKSKHQLLAGADAA